MSWTCLLCQNVNDPSDGYGDETTCGYCGNASGGIPEVGTREESLLKAQGKAHHHYTPPPTSSPPIEIPPGVKTVGQLRKLGWTPKMYSDLARITGKSIKEVRTMCDEDESGQRTIPNWSRWDALKLIPNPPARYSAPTVGPMSEQEAGAKAAAAKRAKLKALYEREAAAGNNSGGGGKKKKKNGGKKDGSSGVSAEEERQAQVDLIAHITRDCEKKKRRLALTVVAILIGFGMLLVNTKPIALAVVAAMVGAYYLSAVAAINAKHQELLDAVAEARKDQ